MSTRVYVRVLYTVPGSYLEYLAYGTKVLGACLVGKCWVEESAVWGFVEFDPQIDVSVGVHPRHE